MKTLLTWFLIFGIVLQSLGKLVVWAGYELNLSYIAKELCIEKEKKDSCCKGKCYLKKELKETESKEESSSVKEKYEMMPGDLGSTLVLQVFSVETIVKNNIQELFVLNGFKGSVFHPPHVA